MNGIKPFSVRNRLKLQSVYGKATFICPLFMNAKLSLTLKMYFSREIRPRMRKKYNISLIKGYNKWSRSTGLIVGHRVGTKHYHYFIYKPLSPAECRFININKGIKNTLKEGQYMAVLHLIICK